MDEVATMDATALLDLPAVVPSLLRPITAASMTFLHRNQTEDQLLVALAHAIYQPLPSNLRIYVLAAEFVVLFIVLVCAVMMFEKRSFGGLWIFIARPTSFGTVYVANAVFLLVAAVVVYMLAYQSIALTVAAFIMAQRSTLEYWWVIPLPWYPLVAGGWTSIHGFVLGVSPKSPFSSHQSTKAGWWYLPVPKQAWIVNSLLVVPLAAFSVTTLTFVGLGAAQCFRAKSLAQDILPAALHSQLKKAAFDPIHFAHSNALASDDLIWKGRTVAAAYFNSYRYSCLNLAVFAGFAVLIFIPVLVYGLPNLVSLVDNACRRSSAPLPTGCKTYFSKVWFLLTKGKPGYASNMNTWKMTFLAHIYVILLAICVPAYGALPIYFIAASFGNVHKGNVMQQIKALEFAASILTVLSGTIFAAFCTAATIDPLFRAAIGLSITRARSASTDGEINITVVQYQTRQRASTAQSIVDKDLEATCASPHSTNGSFQSLQAKSDASLAASTAALITPVIEVDLRHSQR